MLRIIGALLSAALLFGWTSIAQAAPPVVVSITPATVGASSTTTETFTVVFDQPVFGVDTTDFTITPTGLVTANISGASGSGTTYTVIVDSITNEGTLRLDLKSAGTGIQNGASESITSGFNTGGVRIVSLPATVPTLTEWAMILLGLMLAGAGAVYTQRRSKTA